MALARPRVVSSRVGRGFDNEVATYLSNRGYHCVKSAGSKGVIDVAAFPVIKGKKILLIQCKAGKGRITVREWSALLILAERSGACSLPLAALRVESQPVFYQLLGPLIPRTRSENLPWRKFIP